MTIEEMREKKKEWGYTYAQISMLSGVPVGTIQKIFRGETKSPRLDTVWALEKVFASSGSDEFRETAPYGTLKHNVSIRWMVIYCSQEKSNEAKIRSAIEKAIK